MRARISLWSSLIALGVLASCSTGPKPPAPGTPAFYWDAARIAYRAGDFRGANKNLMELIRTDNEFATRARPCAIVVSAGLARGYSDMADGYEAGARMNRANPTPFRKQVSASRSLSAGAAMEFAESVHQFLQKDRASDIPLACEYPTGAIAEPAAMRKVAGGILIQDSEKELLETAMLQRGVLQAMTQMAGAPDDAAKTLEMFKAGEAKVARPTFVFAAAKALHDRSELFGSRKLDQPNKLQALCSEADEALKSIPETKDTKALSKKIQAALKKVKGGV